MRHGFPIRCLAALALLTGVSLAAAQTSTVPVLGKLPPTAPGSDPYWGVWPSTDPHVVGTRLVLNFLSRPAPLPWVGPGTSRDKAWYGESGMAFGALRFAQYIHDKELAGKIVARYATIITPAGKAVIPPADHVDRSIFGIVPLEIYRYGNTPEFLALGKNAADLQWARPDANGLSDQTRFWIDDMYMLTILQMQAYRATADRVYLDRAAKEMVAYLDKLQQPTGLFFHGDGAPFYWGRGDGWVAAGMTEVLFDLPADHPCHARILEGYKKMMAALLKYQDESGCWHQLIDKPASFRESSCTGMFAFAFISGVRNGWLPEAEYRQPARKAWIAVCSFLDDNANLAGVCEGTSKNANENFYMTRKQLTGDLHGHEAAIWAAWALLASPVPAK